MLWPKPPFPALCSPLRPPPRRLSLLSRPQPRVVTDPLPGSNCGPVEAVLTGLELPLDEGRSESPGSCSPCERAAPACGHACFLVTEMNSKQTDRDKGLDAGRWALDAGQRVKRAGPHREAPALAARKLPVPRLRGGGRMRAGEGALILLPPRRWEAWVAGEDELRRPPWDGGRPAGAGEAGGRFAWFPDGSAQPSLRLLARFGLFCQM